MVEEKKEIASADTEAHEGSKTENTEENIEVRKADEQNIETAEEAVETKAQEKEAAVEKIKGKEEKPQEVEEVKEEKPQESTFIGNLNYLPEVRKDLPAINPGDMVKVSYRVIEGGKERTQIFEGIVIALKNSGITRTITVRKTSFGIAVERIFPLNSKLVQSIEITKHSKVRRAKLYFLRNLRGKAARLKELR